MTHMYCERLRPERAIIAGGKCIPCARCGTLPSAGTRVTLSLPVVVPAVSKNPRIGLMMSIGIGVRGDQRDRFAARMPPPTPWEQVRKLLSRVFQLDAFGELGQNVGGACERSLHPGIGGFL